MHMEGLYHIALKNPRGTRAAAGFAACLNQPADLTFLEVEALFTGRTGTLLAPAMQASQLVVHI